MESSEISEEFGDWEEIHLPSYNHSSSNLPSTQHINLNIRAGEPEYLPLLQPEEDGEPSENAEPETELSRQQQTESDSPLPSRDPEMGLPCQQWAKSDSKLSAVMGEVKTVICARWRRMIAVLGSGFKCPTFVPAAALAVVILACMKVVQGRNRLLLLLREKDQRIMQLLHQIAYMKHILATRRRVPVLRIT